MKKLLLLAFMSLPFVSSAQGLNFTAVFTFDSVKNNTGRVDPTPLPVVPALAFDSVRSFGASPNSSASQRFSFTNWTTGATNGNGTYSALTGSLDPAKYYEFEIIPDNSGPYPAHVAIDSIEFRFQRSGTGVRTYVVRGSADAFATNLTAGSLNPKITVETGNVFYFNVDSTSGQNGSKIYPDSANYSDNTGSVQFRFYGYNAEGTTGTFSVDNVTFYGRTFYITSVAELNEKTVKIYPNPGNASTISVAAPEGDKMIELYDVAGNLVSKSNSFNTVSTVDVSILPSGTYLVKVISASGTRVLKYTRTK